MIYRINRIGWLECGNIVFVPLLVLLLFSGHTVVTVVTAVTLGNDVGGTGAVLYC